MRVVFLDFDGVLNSYTFLVENPGPFDRLDPAAVGRLDRLVRETGTKVVISSSWRLGRSLDELRRILAAAGFKGDVVGRTPEMFPAEVGESDPDILRCMEIRAWMDASATPVERFVVLDDNPLDELAPNLVRTSMIHGLGDEHVEAAISILAGLGDVVPGAGPSKGASLG